MKIFVAALLCVFSLLACSGRIDGAIRQGGASDVWITASLEPRMAGLIRSLSAVMGAAAAQAGTAPILDGPAISQSLAASPGVRTVSLVNNGDTALGGTAAISRVGDILSLGEGTSFITYQENAGTNPGGRFSVTLDRKTVPALVALLSPEAVDYLSALMAPVILEEEMTKDEYLSLVSSLYGKPIADEIKAASILAALDFPGPVTRISGGSASGSRAFFDIPLLDLLVLETPLSWEVLW